MRTAQIKQLESIIREHGHIGVLEEIATIIRDKSPRPAVRQMMLNDALNVFRRAAKTTKKEVDAERLARLKEFE